MTTITRSVIGMTCRHCVRTVSAAVSDVPGVRTVEVDLLTARLVVEGDADLVDAQVEAAVEAAGYGVGPA